VTGSFGRGRGAGGKRTQGSPTPDNTCRTLDFAYSYPPGWRELRPDERYVFAQNSRLAVESGIISVPPATSVQASITASRFGSATAEDRREMFDMRVRLDFVRQREQALMGSLNRDIPRVRVGREPAMALEFRLPIAPGRPVDAMRRELVVVHRGVGYTLVLEAVYGDYPLGLGALETILATWAWSRR